MHNLGHLCILCLIWHVVFFPAFATNSVLPTKVVSTAVLTPTPSPIPSEELIPVNSYRANEKEGDGPACIHLQAGIQLLVNYTNKDKLEVCKSLVDISVHEHSLIMFSVPTSSLVYSLWFLITLKRVSVSTYGFVDFG